MAIVIENLRFDLIPQCLFFKDGKTTLSKNIKQKYEIKEIKHWLNQIVGNMIKKLLTKLFWIFKVSPIIYECYIYVFQIPCFTIINLYFS